MNPTIQARNSTAARITATFSLSAAAHAQPVLTLWAQGVWPQAPHLIQAPPAGVQLKMMLWEEPSRAWLTPHPPAAGRVCLVSGHAVSDASRVLCSPWKV